ncbi:ElaB/YqjD/DUF883 family membrane-anchored ribosome-binding protein [Nocardioides ginsengisegetis]|uniref:ElaB/YqjD/DUF883 family membrane-anchored ribosome-binding protein n=1 Tax=Nocardioides ginsengisegetis TaxID=661491 RepID=A0A7W3PAS4_9ACTN|nr:excalibur calcium-binding domain-containing protein [Nocardioides ginsengisegetis]MBA8804777.1 ElaB/YqjD/DUF883 family membrane-anchored ribosome-binding protein [Nocardioides ginsengisegetis]
MSQQELPPTLEQYPGYFPAAKAPFWTRGKVGIAAGVAGLVIGVVASPGSAESQPAAAKQAPSPTISTADIQTKIDAAVSAAEDRLSGKIATVRDNAQQRLSDMRERSVTAQRTAVTRAIARTHAQDHAALIRAVAAAKAAAAPVTAPPAPAAPSTDPRFSYCYEANAAGYGPYFEGQDPEYYWYDDADNDGEVCE